MAVLEYVVKDHIKVVYICSSNDNSCEVLGDLPAIPSCLEINDCIEINKVKSCLTNWLKINEYIFIRFTIAKVLGEDSIIMFQAINVPRNLGPEELFDIVTSFINRTCGKTSLTH